MSRNRSSLVFVGFAAAATVGCPLAAGCIVADGDEQMVPGDAIDVPLAAATTTGDPDDPPVGHNPFYPMCFWHPDVQHTYQQLATTNLVNTQGQLPSMPYLGLEDLEPRNTATCKTQALKYLIQCALADGATATDPASGATYTGRFGLAPEWRTGPLSSSNMEWVTSCLTAHLNGTGIPVSLLLEGNHSGFQFNRLQTTYPERDSITWGNVFVPSTSGNTTIHACYFSELNIACEAGGAALAINNRICDEVPNCGLMLHGNCDTACTWPTGTSGYWSCGAPTAKTTNFRVRLTDFTMYGTACTQ